MSQIERFTMRAYGHLLKLYPADFQAEFGEEMQMVFALAVAEAARHSNHVLLAVIGREVRDLPLGVMREYQREQARRRATELRVNANDKRVWRARLVTRLSSAVLSLLILASLVPSLQFSTSLNWMSTSIGIFFLLLFMTAINLLIAWRWEQAGGLMSIGSGLGMGVFMAAYIHTLASAQISLMGMILIGVLWALPFVIFGVLFYKLGRHKMQIAHMGHITHPQPGLYL